MESESADNDFSDEYEEGFTCDDGKCLDISQRCNNIEVWKAPNNKYNS